MEDAQRTFRETIWQRGYFCGLRVSKSSINGARNSISFCIDKSTMKVDARAGRKSVRRKRASGEDYQ